MVYVLILLGLAVVIAPLVSVMPSKSQRAKAALRDEARGLSFRVSLRPLPAVPPRFLLQVDTELACYERRLPRSSPVPNRGESFVCVEGAWWPTRGAGNAPDWLAELPEGAVYAERVEQAGEQDGRWGGQLGGAADAGRCGRVGGRVWAAL